MKALKISTEIIELIELKEPLLKSMQKEVGGLIEIVHPKRLKEGYVMVVDEEGLCKNKPINTIGSWLYETDIHGHPIVGDILILKEKREPDGEIIFIGIDK